MVQFIKTSNLFASPTVELNSLISTYLLDTVQFDKDNMALCSIDAIHKLHPVDYGTNKVTKEWLTEACLRQNKFCQEFPFDLLNYEDAYKHYVEFLYLRFKAPLNSVVVPNKLGDFIWHSHMQDNQLYKE